MAQMMRIYLANLVSGDRRQLFEKTPKPKTEPGWPGTHFIELELSQFYEEIPMLNSGIAKQIESSPHFVGVSVTTAVKVPPDDVFLKNRVNKGAGKVWTTLDTSERPYLVTIWSPTIKGAMQHLRSVDPAPPLIVR